MRLTDIEAFCRNLKKKTWFSREEIIEEIQQSQQINLVYCKDCWKRDFDSHPADDNCFCKYGETQLQKEFKGYVKIDELPKA